MVPHRITWKMELPSLKQHIVKAVLSNSISKPPSAQPRGKHYSLDRKGSVRRRPVGSVPRLRLHELSLVCSHQHHDLNASPDKLTVVKIPLLRLSQDADLC